jgi:hypothetical protein
MPIKKDVSNGMCQLPLFSIVTIMQVTKVKKQELIAKHTKAGVDHFCNTTNGNPSRISEWMIRQDLKLVSEKTIHFTLNTFIKYVKTNISLLQQAYLAAK